MYIGNQWLYALISAASKAIGPKRVWFMLKHFKLLIMLQILFVAALGVTLGIQTWKLHKAEIELKEAELKQEVERIIIKGFLPEPANSSEDYKEDLL